MDIEVAQANQVALVIPKGDLGAASAAELKRTLDELLDTGNTKLVLDMGRVSYIDSAVWGELALAATRARKGGGELRVCAISGEMLAVLNMMRLSRAVTVYRTREHAMVFEVGPAKDPSRGVFVRSSFRRPAVGKLSPGVGPARHRSPAN